MKITAQWLQYDTDSREWCETVGQPGGRVSKGMVTVQQSAVYPKGRRYTAAYTAEEAVENCSLGLEFRWEMKDRKHYIMVPAAVYNGNRFRILKVPYAPMFRPEQYEKNPEVTVTDIPHLPKEGDGCISLRAGDSSIPAVFIYMPNEKKMIALLYPCHPMEGMESGVQIQEQEEGDEVQLAIRIAAPIVRAKGMYRFGKIRSDVPCEDSAAAINAGEKLLVWVDAYEYSCCSIAEFYQKAMELSHLPERTAGSSERPHTVPLAKAFKLVEDKYNLYSWHPDYHFYCVGENQNFYSCWQTGWVGGINAAYPLYCDGKPQTQMRALKTMDFMFQKMQAPGGLFYGISDGEQIYGDDFAEVENKGFSLVRKSADALYFAACILIEMRKRGEEPDPLWVEGLRRCADGFCRLFEKEGQLGQFIDVDTEEILVGSSASGGMAPGGLALCAAYFGEERYLAIAEKIGAHYYENYTAIGLANGGPGEILSAPDSESAYALLESDVVLYECTRDPKYLQWAEEAAAVYSTWCMPYDYPFPKESVFGQADMHTTGAVWANVQNKHGAPGPCTHSGSAMFRLARYTGKSIYMEICCDTSHNITQYLSRDDRPLWNYSHTKTAPSGFMCERVSTCDWEGYDKIGGVYETGCWCEATTMCVYTDIPGIWVDLVHDRIWVSDHVDVYPEGKQLICQNPTVYPAIVKILIDSGEWKQGDFDYRKQLQIVEIPAGGERRINL